MHLELALASSLLQKCINIRCQSKVATSFRISRERACVSLERSFVLLILITKKT